MSHNDFSISFILEKDKFGIIELKKFKWSLSKKLGIPKEETLKFSYDKTEFTITPDSTDFAYLITVHTELYKDTIFRTIETVIKAVWNSLDPPPLFCVGDDHELYNEFRNATLKLALPPVRVINILGRKYVEKIGEKNLLDAPVYQVEKLKNGIRLILNKDPLDLTNKEKVEEYLKRFIK